MDTFRTTAHALVSFEGLIVEISLDHIGLILGMAMSRLACFGNDGHPPWELCAVFLSLVAGLDAIDDSSERDVRLLFGLKETMSGAELHIRK